MKTLNLILKIVAALAAVAGLIYVIATYGDKIVAWVKKLVGKFTCCDDACDCDCDCQCTSNCEDCPCEADCDDCPCCDNCEGDEDDGASEDDGADTGDEGAAVEEVAADESDFEG